MKKHILVALIASLVLLGAVGSVSADDPIQNFDVQANGVGPQDACPFATACNVNGYAYYVRNDNAGGTGVLGWHNNAAGTAPGLYGYSGSGSALALGVLGVIGSNAPGGSSAGVRGINNGTSGAGIGVYGSQNGSGYGVYGYTPRGLGVYGNTGSGTGTYGASNTGYGAFGYHTATTGTAAGVYGYSRSMTANAPGVLGVIGSNAPGGYSSGVRGINNGTGGNGIGVYGSQAGSGWGVYGYAPRGLGVYGSTSTGFGTYGVSGTGTGAFGYHTATTGTAAGVYGLSRSRTSNAPAVLGVINSNAPGGSSSGVRGINNGTGGAGIGVYGSQAGSGWGVYGYAPRGLGVYGNTSSGTGVLGYHTATTGTSSGVTGYTRSVTQNAPAVYGVALSTNPGPNVTGVRGHSNGTAATGIGVWGSQSGSGWGVFGSVGNAAGYAGYFAGRVRVTGTLFKGGGAFQIDHPLDPTNKFLQHSFVESPDMMNVYNGNVTLAENGQAWVTLPDYFQALNRDFRYQLSAIGSPAPRLFIASEISDNRFKIAGGREGQKVSWQVTGVRQDPYAEANRIQVEVDKPADERGLYLHPDAYGVSAEKDLTWKGANMAVDAEGASLPMLEQEGALEWVGVELPDLSANMELIENTAEELYPVPDLDQEPPTSTTAEGVAAP